MRGSQNPQDRPQRALRTAWRRARSTPSGQHSSQKRLSRERTEAADDLPDARGSTPSSTQTPSTMQQYLAHPSDVSKGHTVVVDGRRLTMANLGKDIVHGEVKLQGPP